MSFISQGPEKSKINLASQLDEAARVRDAAPDHEHFDDVISGQLVHDPECPYCHYRRLWRRYNHLLNDEIEMKAAALRCSGTSLDELAETARLDVFEMDLGVTPVSPRRRLEIGAALEAVEYALRQERKVSNGSLRE